MTKNNALIKTKTFNRNRNKNGTFFWRDHDGNEHNLSELFNMIFILSDGMEKLEEKSNILQEKLESLVNCFEKLIKGLGNSP